MSEGRTALWIRKAVNRDGFSGGEQGEGGFTTIMTITLTVIGIHSTVEEYVLVMLGGITAVCVIPLQHIIANKIVIMFGVGMQK
jgi:hypothetical protein